MKTFTVNPHGGDFASLSDAAAALKDSEDATVLKIMPGVYRESVVFKCSNLTIEGDPSGAVYICGANYARMKDEDGKEWGTFRTAVIRTDGDNITLRNITIENTAGIGFRIGQAVALYSDGNGFLCDNCKLIGHQDTLFTAPFPQLNKHGKNEGFGPKGDLPRTPTKQVFRNCYIEGDIDFIFGGATALFEKCHIFSHDAISEYRMQEMIASRNNDWHSISPKACRGYVCAPCTVEGLDYGYLFLNCYFYSNCPKATVYLGRPWRPYGKAYFVGCILGDHINPVLFNDWDDRKNRNTSVFAISDCKWTNGSPVTALDEECFARFPDKDEIIKYVDDFTNYCFS
ncbi:MAG: pectin methylesterase [Lachnospiraceae bacterium]|nr:pectin methylesterase [Lachnospiraceae bacterium]